MLISTLFMSRCYISFSWNLSFFGFLSLPMGDDFGGKTVEDGEDSHLKLPYFNICLLWLSFFSIEQVNNEKCGTIVLLTGLGCCWWRIKKESLMRSWFWSKTRGGPTHTALGAVALIGCVSTSKTHLKIEIFGNTSKTKIFGLTDLFLIDLTSLHWVAVLLWSALFNHWWNFI